MKSKISDKEWLLHILDSIDSIIDFTQDLSYKQYNDDFKLRLALIKLLEIIGEAATGITEETQLRFPEVELNNFFAPSPISVKEVLAWSKPVIVNDVGDLAEYVIPGRNGYIVDAANSREVAATIENACANAHSMREACIASMELYDEGGD